MTLAGNFLSIAGAAAAKSLSVPHISLVKKADAELKLIGQEAEAVKNARETLKTTPDDPAANLAVGRYEALRQGNWEPALPHLVKSGDSELMSVARKELDAPKDGAAQQKVADEWWALAEKEKDSTWIRTAIQSRAAHWYRQAATQVTGLSLTLIHERLKTIDEAPSPIRLGGSAMAELKSLRGHKGAVTSLNLSPDGKVLFSGSLDATIRRWEMKTAKNLTTFPAGQPIHALAFSPSGRYLALGFKETMKVIEVDNPLAKGSPFPYPGGQAWPSAYWVDDEKICTVYTGGFGYAIVNGGTSAPGRIPCVRARCSCRRTGGNSSRSARRRTCPLRRHGLRRVASELASTTRPSPPSRRRSRWAPSPRPTRRSTSSTRRAAPSASSSRERRPLRAAWNSLPPATVSCPAAMTASSTSGT